MVLAIYGSIWQTSCSLFANVSTACANVKMSNRSTNSLPISSKWMVLIFFRATKCRAKQLMCFASKASNKQFANSTQTTFTKWIEILSHIYIVINLHRTNAIIKYLLTLPAAGQFAGQTENPCGHYMVAFLHRLRFHFVKQALIRIMFCILFHNFSLLVCNLFNLITTLMVR